MSFSPVFLWRKLHTKQKVAFYSLPLFAGEPQILLMPFPSLKSHADSWAVLGQAPPAAFGVLFETWSSRLPLQCKVEQAKLLCSATASIQIEPTGTEGSPYSAAPEEQSPAEQPVSTICSKINTRAEFPFPKGCVLCRYL